MKRVVVWFLLLLATIGCARSGPANEAAYTLLLDVAPAPASVGNAVLLFTLTDANDDAIDDATISVRGDMTHAGMVPVLGEVAGGIDGLYSVPFEWTMAGDWFVVATVTLPDGTTFERRFELSVDGDMEMDTEMDMGGDGG